MGGPVARSSKHSESRRCREGPSYCILERLRARSVCVAKIHGFVSTQGSRRCRDGGSLERLRAGSVWIAQVQRCPSILGAGGAGTDRLTAAWKGLGQGQYGWPKAGIRLHSGSRRCREAPSHGSLERLRVGSVWVAKMQGFRSILGGGAGRDRITAAWKGSWRGHYGWPKCKDF